MLRIFDIRMMLRTIDILKYLFFFAFYYVNNVFLEGNVKYFVSLCVVSALFCGKTEAMAMGERVASWVKSGESAKKFEIRKNSLFSDLSSAMDSHYNNLVKVLAEEAFRNHFFGWSKNQKSKLLFYAIENNLEEVVKGFAKENKSKKENSYIRSAFDFNVRGWRGETPLLVAIDQGNTAIVECLLENGADPNIVDASNGFSPLMLACWMGDESLVKTLIRLKANVNALSRLGCSPLSLAMGGNYPEIVKILKKAGADVYLENQNGDTPMSMALYFDQKLAENDREKAKWNAMVRILADWNDAREEAEIVKQPDRLSIWSFFRSLFIRRN